MMVVVGVHQMEREWLENVLNCCVHDTYLVIYSYSKIFQYIKHVDISLMDGSRRRQGGNE